MPRRLGVNIDHIATLRQARGTAYPDPLDALPILSEAAVDQVTLHLREDRRHIQDRDLREIIGAGILPVNLEMAAVEEMVRIACMLKPQTVTLVPERREELTTEGGLDVCAQSGPLRDQVKRMQGEGLRVSLFIDPEKDRIAAARELGVGAIELHTGAYCAAPADGQHRNELARLRAAAEYARGLGMAVFAGHGLNGDNLPPVAAIKEIEEYNIGHSIIARAVFIGLAAAIHAIRKILT